MQTSRLGAGHKSSELQFNIFITFGPPLISKSEVLSGDNARRRMSGAGLPGPERE